MSRTTRTAALTAVAAAATLGVVGLAAAPADAAAAKHCSGKAAAVGSSKVTVQLCAQINGTKLTETATLVNTGAKNATATVEFSASWDNNNAGAGGIKGPLTVKAKKTESPHLTFDAGKGSYSASTTVQVGKASKTLTVKFSK